MNRVGGDTKDKGFIIDYVGIGHHLKKAIDVYDEREQNEVIDALSFPDDELLNLKNSHVEIMTLLEKDGLTDLTDHDAFFDVFYDEDLRFDYMQAFKKFTKCLNLVFPARQAFPGSIKQARIQCVYLPSKVLGHCNGLERTTHSPMA